jgi:hypothetical protein
MQFKTKTLIRSGTKVNSAVPPWLPQIRATQDAITGVPVAGYFVHRQATLAGGQASSVYAFRNAYRAFTSLSQFADGGPTTPAFALVDPGRFELPASSMPLRRAPNCAMGPGYCMVLEPVVPVDLGGFEPPASSVRLKRAPNCATGPLLNAGEILPDSDLYCQVNSE